MESQRHLVEASFMRDGQKDVTPIRLKCHPAYVPPAEQYLTDEHIGTLASRAGGDVRALAAEVQRLRALLGGDAA